MAYIADWISVADIIITQVRSSKYSRKTISKDEMDDLVAELTFPLDYMNSIKNSSTEDEIFSLNQDQKSDGPSETLRRNLEFCNALYIITSYCMEKRYKYYYLAHAIEQLVFKNDNCWDFIHEKKKKEMVEYITLVLR